VKSSEGITTNTDGSLSD